VHFGSTIVKTLILCIYREKEKEENYFNNNNTILI